VFVRVLHFSSSNSFLTEVLEHFEKIKSYYPAVSSRPFWLLMIQPLYAMY
jgi:hypothetical protein